MVLLRRERYDENSLAQSARSSTGGPAAVTTTVMWSPRQTFTSALSVEDDVS